MGNHTKNNSLNHKLTKSLIETKRKTQKMKPSCGPDREEQGHSWQLSVGSRQKKVYSMQLAVGNQQQLQTVEITANRKLQTAN
jgi:hypothetical protein